MKKQKKYLWIFLICLVLAYLPGVIGSFFTINQVESEWYNSIKPEITPPNWVFPIVWNILFLLIGISLYFAWTNSSKKQKKYIVLIYGINLIANMLWSILYFRLQNPLLSFIDIILILITIIVAMIYTYKINKVSSLLLIPYLLWVSFASFLNYLSI